ncbi:MAG: chromosome segregation protein SMC, partial [Eubacteriales bacterium]|nr:chromosome segregation protein SMC [Eubacteriales bacterium]
MYLKNIEVHGFKSFAQKINFEFQNGITGIVGPNGSGKSNVADAVRWVLGEQSAKQLRGGNMQDVIFSGTEARKPLSFASVAITLDNSDRKLPVDYQEVTVTRRLYRSGESEYLLNGSSCRLKDINEMFYDTGIGKEGYSIIGQGQIDKILSGKAEERRELFDEAAGIVKFKRRKTATLKKLEEEQANLVRVTDILSELTRQLEPLERQSETAKLYLAKRDQLKEMDVNLFLLEHERSTKILKELDEKLTTAKQELAETRTAYDKTKEEYDHLEQELTELNDRMEKDREQSQQQALQKQQLSGQMDVMREQILSEERNSDHYKERLVSIEEDLAKHEKTKEEFRKERESLKHLVENGQKDLESQEKELARLQETIADCTKAVEEGQGEIMEILNSRATAKGQAERFDTLMEQIDIRKAEISQKILHLKGEESLQNQRMEEAKRVYQEVTSKIRSMNEEVEKLKKDVDLLQTELAKQNRELDNTQKNYHREESRLESLRNMTERYDGYGNAIRRVMEQKAQVPGLKGVVADLIHVDKNYEIAIETALGGSIQNIVTDNEQTAKRMIEFLKKNRYGRATFLPLSNMKGKNEFAYKEALREKGAIGLASDLVHTEEEYSGLVRQLLGRILVVDHIDHAIAIAAKYRHSFRMVTIEGESLNMGGSMTGGAFKNNSNLLGRRREIEEMERSVNGLAARVKKVQESIDATRMRRNTMRDRITALQESLRVQYVEQNTAKMNMDALSGKEKELESSYSRIRLDQEEVKQKLSEIQEDHDRIARVLQDSEKDEKELQDYIQTKQKELEVSKEEEARLTELLNESRLAASQGSQKEEFLSENLLRLSQEIQNL